MLNLAHDLLIRSLDLLHRAHNFPFHVMSCLGLHTTAICGELKKNRKI